MAQTTLIFRWASALLLILTNAALGQTPNSIGDILDAPGARSSARASGAGVAIEPLRYLDSLDVRGRHRFILPLPRIESGSGAQRLRDTLQDLQILDGIGAAIEAIASEVSSRAEQASARGDLIRRDRLRGQAAGLRSVLEVSRRQLGEETSERPWDGIRVSRATEPLSLLAWNSGAYSVATTPHFSVASQAGDRPTADMAQACELAFEVWSQLFAERFRSEQIGAPKSDSRIRTERFRVVMFRTRDAYVKALRAIEPKIGVSTGYYSPKHRLSFFYWDGPKSLPTLVHELTHQFFQEWSSQASRFDSDRHPGFWAVEGVALYLESFSMRKVGGAAVIDIGGWDSPRLQAGRYRRLHDEYWVSWDEFSRLDGEAFRNSKDIAAWYSQSCGLVHRWLDGSEDEFQQFTDYLRAVYDGKGAEAASKLAMDDDSMRSGYDRYLMTSWRSDGQASARPFFPNRREAVLSRCEVSSSDLLAWPGGCREMDWLDLSFSGVDDGWLLEAGDPPWRITRLNLEYTATTDAAIPQIASMKELKELDLTRCEVTDGGIAALREHPNLRHLWLGQTRITDASIDTLLSIPQLERLTISGSGISEAGWKRILARKPYLKR